VKDLKEHPDIQDVYDVLQEYAIENAEDGDEDVESPVSLNKFISYALSFFKFQIIVHCTQMEFLFKTESTDKYDGKDYLLCDIDQYIINS
jgi:hypothetical protein